MELNDNFILPKYVIDLWCVGKSKPVPSVWDFGFVTELDRLDARQAFICELYEMLDSVSER